jgi:hypothetical protein
MNRLPKDFIKFFDSTTPQACAFSMILESDKQNALDSWAEKNNISTDEIRQHCCVRRERLDQRGTMWQEITFYKYRPVFKIVWDTESQTIKVEDL